METTNLNRRAFIATAASLSIAASRILLVAHAQDSTPEDGHDHVPEALVASRPAGEIIWAIADTEMDLPAEIVAGLNRVTVTNSGSMPIHLVTFSVPEGVSDDVVLQFGSDEDAPFPDWFASQWFPGNPTHLGPEQSAAGYVHYHPGRYFVMDLYGGGHGFFTATGNAWGVPEPHADRVIGMVDNLFIGFDEPIAAGPQTWRVVNNGATWHEIALMRTPGFDTPEASLEMLMSVESPDDYPVGVEDVGGVGIMSPGAAVLLEVDLEVGQYTAFCFAPDGFVGPPHIVLGMISTFEVV